MRVCVCVHACVRVCIYVHRISVNESPGVYFLPFIMYPRYSEFKQVVACIVYPAFKSIKGPGLVFKKKIILGEAYLGKDLRKYNGYIHMHMFARMYVCVYVCMFVCMHTNACTYYAHTYLCEFICVIMFVGLLLELHSLLQFLSFNCVFNNNFVRMLTVTKCAYIFYHVTL